MVLAKEEGRLLPHTQTQPDVLTERILLDLMTLCLK